MGAAWARCAVAANARSAQATVNIPCIETLTLTTRVLPLVVVDVMLAQRRDQHDDRDDRHDCDDDAIRDEYGVRDPRARGPA